MTFVRLPEGTPADLVKLQAELRERLRPAPGRQVHLDEATHVYAVGGERVPSVTEIRRPPMHLRRHEGGLEDHDFAPTWANERGRKVHELVAQVETFRAVDLMPDVGEYRPFLEAWEAARRATGWVTFAVEHALEGVLWTTCEVCGMRACSHREPEAVRYAGTLDLLGVMTTPPPFFPVSRLEPVVVDLKTGSTMPSSVGVQVALYVAAVCGYVNYQVGPGSACLPIYGAGLRLGEDGKQIDAGGKMTLGRKRTKKDDENYPEGWDVVPKVTTFRPITGEDLSKARAAALTWHEARQAEQGGDAFGDHDNIAHLGVAPDVTGATFPEMWT